MIHVHPPSDSGSDSDSPHHRKAVVFSFTIYAVMEMEVYNNGLIMLMVILQLDSHITLSYKYLLGYLMLLMTIIT